MDMVFQVVVFWVMTPCSDKEGNKRFGESYYLHLQGKDGAASFLQHRRLESSLLTMQSLLIEV
jgi:hypothetical protein